MARLYSHAVALKTASKPAFSGKVFENFMGSTDKRMDTERVVVLKIETNCHVKLSRGRVEFGDCLKCHAGSIRRLPCSTKPLRSHGLVQSPVFYIHFLSRFLR